jgi:quercetin dioxygenase-like cupin family protein
LHRNGSNLRYTGNMDKQETGTIEIRHLPAFGGGIDLVCAKAVTTSVPRHTHASYCIGAIKAGTRQSVIHGSRVTASAGAIVIINPGDVHSCSSNGQSYVMVCLPLTQVTQIAEEITGKSQSPPYFPLSMLDDQPLFYELVTLSHVWENGSFCATPRSSLPSIQSIIIVPFIASKNGSMPTMPKTSQRTFCLMLPA